MSETLERALVWFRRDLRAVDHAALAQALHAANEVWCAFVLDRALLGPLPRADRRVELIVRSLAALDDALARRGGGLIVLAGDPTLEIPRLAHELRVQAVYANRDYEPYARSRDRRVADALAGLRIDFYTRKDHVIFERDELKTAGGTPYSVFTPYKKAWLAQVAPADLALRDARGRVGRLAAPPARAQRLPSLEALGFLPTNIRELVTPGERGALAQLRAFETRIDRYAEARDYPALEGPSHLSAHLRFGTVSIRTCVRMAHERARAGSQGAAVWLSELIWRDFFQQILYHHPHVVERAFRREYDAVEWEQGARADESFAAWCAGRTGYPLVDAAMRQLAATGYMHNRLRMVAASFLTKHLGVDWRRGERYFALQLNDFDLAANNGGWQWAASTGCDAQPYFRIFNPVKQAERFDPDGEFVRRHVPELAALAAPAIHAPWRASGDELLRAGVELDGNYPRPVVDHEHARQRTLERYSIAKRGGDKKDYAELCAE